MASTPSHGLPPKDFQDVDPIKADSNGIGSTGSESNFETPTAEKKKTNKDGTSAKYTTPVTQGATPEVPIIIEDNDNKATPESSSSDLKSPINDLTCPDGDGAYSEEFQSLNTMCQKAKESGKREDAVCGKHKRKPSLKLRSPNVTQPKSRTRRPVKRGIFF